MTNTRGLTVQLIADEFDWAARWSAKKRRCPITDYDLGEAPKVSPQLCPSCEHVKDVVCFQSHRRIARPGPAQPVCNACRADQTQGDPDGV